MSDWGTRMKTFLGLLVISVICNAVYGQDKPNIVLFIADDLTYWDIGTYGGQAKTPNIDRLATEGIQFENAYQAVAVCGPTRHNLLTGLYPVKNGAYPQSGVLNEGVKTLPHYLQPLGYRTAYVGKRHFRPESQFPFEYLDENKAMNFDAIDRFLASTEGKPFMLMVGTTEPHYRWDKGDASKYNADRLVLPKNWIDTKKTREYYAKYLGEVTYQDWEVGETIRLLKKHDLYDNTAYFYTSEQGASFPFAKWTCYEAGVHTALIVRWPGKIKQGSKAQGIVDYTDVLPTLIELAGGKVPSELDGQSFKTTLLGGKDAGKAYTFSMQTTRGEPWGGDHFGVRAVRDKRYTYITNLHPYMLFENHLTRYGDGFFNTWREAGWKDPEANKLFLAYITRPAVELYDREQDPFEMNNLAKDPKYAKTIELLDSKLKAWMAYTGDKGHETEMEAYEHQWKTYVKRHPGAN